MGLRPHKGLLLARSWGIRWRGGVVDSGRSLLMHPVACGHARARMCCARACGARARVERTVRGAGGADFAGGAGGTRAPRERRTHGAHTLACVARARAPGAGARCARSRARCEWAVKLWPPSSSSVSVLMFKPDALGDLNWGGRSDCRSIRGTLGAGRASRSEFRPCRARRTPPLVVALPSVRGRSRPKRLGPASSESCFVWMTSYSMVQCNTAYQTTHTVGAMLHPPQCVALHFTCTTPHYGIP